ncbi:SMP-30/gluconolactonase/LRE family protein [Agromyces kandeliae]|uniref:Superoxide dismutase n=1 Tax=Agromyces kandeliae TaxID=2666141 RepID=A0A6L5R4Q0_9MICO|nr:superoxide dismutase [Agromyces kandeliae]MRX44875.1 superoxide dismutase [Agromyces kandeliae]
MDSRIVARSSVAGAFAALLIASVASPAAAIPASSSGGGAVESVIDLPDGFQPEGIAIAPGGTAYFGSLADGDIYAADLRSGEGEVVSEGPGTPSVGLDLDAMGRLFVSGGDAGDARVVDTATGEVLASYQLTEGAGFINDVIVTRDAAWFTNSFAAELYRLPLGPGGALPDPSEVETVPLGGDWVQQGFFNANGIVAAPDGKALLVIQSSTATLYRVDPATGDATAVDLGGANLPNGDGMLVIGRTLYVVQNQLNQVAKVRLDPSGSAGEVVDTLTSADFDVPTTVDSFGNGLYLPNARFGTPPTPTTTYEAVRVDR